MTRMVRRALAIAVRRGRLLGGRPPTRDQNARLPPVLKRVSGPEYPHTVAARYELATWTVAAACLGVSKRDSPLPCSPPS